jgi:hypothetical protein
MLGTPGMESPRTPFNLNAVDRGDQEMSGKERSGISHAEDHTGFAIEIPLSVQILFVPI